MPETIFLDGEIYEIIYQNDDNGYTVCEIDCDGTLITACGYMPFLAPGEQVHFEGSYVNHPDYGEQFSVKNAQRALPKRVGAVLSYLSSGIISGVRESTAKKIVEKFGEDTLDTIALHPEKLSQIRGISPMRAKKISEAFLLHRDAAQTVIFLQEYGVTPNVSIRVYKHFGQTAVDLIRQNPYILCDSIDRIGFKTADRIALSMNMPHNYPGRIASGIKHMLTSLSYSGHTCFKTDELITCCARFLGCDINDVTNVLLSMESSTDIISEDSFTYLPSLYNAELSCARRLNDLAALLRPPLKHIKSVIESSVPKLSEKQRQAVEKACTEGVFIVTGGPGTGKTTIMKTVLEIFKENNLNIALCAPTGKAAKRLSQSCREDAKTLHRLLEAESKGGDSMQFSRNEQNPIKADVIIIDEMSMVDVSLFDALLRALRRGARLIMAGDADQLPSVGAGNVLNDMIKSGCLPYTMLDEVFRQAAQSRIVTNAHLINSGNMPLDNSGSTDFFFMERTTEGALSTICELLCGRLTKAYGYDISEMQVLTPSRKGIVGSANLNRVLQEKLNPPSKRKAEKKIGERFFREGDKVIQNKNNYDMLWTLEKTKEDGAGVFNGDMGTIEKISEKEKILRVRFDDGKIADYDFASTDELDTSYALTVHKSQGSEWSAVIIPVCPFPPMLMTRNLLYTGVTRAKKLVVLVGSKKCVSEMVSNNHIQVRYSSLCKRLREVFGVENS